MVKKKVISVIAFVAIAILSGGIVSIYVNKGSVDVKGAAPVEIADTEQAENEKTAQAGIESTVQADKVTFSCGVSGCTQTEAHRHGLCGIDGCTQTGEHSHGESSGGHHQSGHGGGHH